MDIIELAAEALKPVAADGIPVQQGWYDESLQKTHVTLWNLGEMPEGHSDDNVETLSAQVQVTIFSDRDRHDLARRIRRLLTAAGFTWTGGGQDQVQHDGAVWMRPQRFRLDYEEEE